MTIHTPDSTEPAPKCRGDISQEPQESQEAGVTEEDAIRSGVHVNLLSLTETQEQLL